MCVRECDSSQYWFSPVCAGRRRWRRRGRASAAMNKKKKKHLVVPPASPRSPPRSPPVLCVRLGPRVSVKVTRSNGASTGTGSRGSFQHLRTDTVMAEF